MLIRQNWTATLYNKYLFRCSGCRFMSYALCLYLLFNMVMISLAYYGHTIKIAREKCTGLNISAEKCAELYKQAVKFGYISACNSDGINSSICIELFRVHMFEFPFSYFAMFALVVWLISQLVITIYFKFFFRRDILSLFPINKNENNIGIV